MTQACSKRPTLQITVDPVPAELDTNVPKISGKVTDRHATVSVNGVSAFVSDDGTFFAYVQVAPRIQSTIEIKAESGGQITSQSLTTSFYPKPFISVARIDTRGQPATLEGWVSYPNSTIEITGNLKGPEN